MGVTGDPNPADVDPAIGRRGYCSLLAADATRDGLVPLSAAPLRACLATLREVGWHVNRSHAVPVVVIDQEPETLTNRHRAHPAHA